MITRIGTRDLGLLCWRLGLAFDVGHDPVRIFEREAGDGRSRHARHMKSIAGRIREGCSIAGAIHEQGNYFPPNFHRLVDAGEKSGRLEKLFKRMADHYKEGAGLQGEFRRSLILPIVQLVIALLVVSILICIPPLLADRHDDVVNLLGLGLVGGRGLAILWAVVAATAVAMVAIWGLLRRGKLVFLRSSMIHIPVLGRAILTFDEVMFVQSLTMAIESGMTAASAIPLGFRGCSSEPFRREDEAAREAILRGREMHSVLQDTGLFSHETIEAVELGEASGRLAETLNEHLGVLRMRARFAMVAIVRIVSSVVWITVATVLALLILRIFGRYVSQIERAAMETVLMPVSGGRQRP